MKLFIALACLTVTTNSFAMSCPNGASGTFYEGDTLSEVQQQCGEPITTTTKVEASSQRWTYYKIHSYDQGNAKVIFLVSIPDNKVVDIIVEDVNAQSDQLCATALQTGNNQPFVNTICNKYQNNLSSTSVCGAAVNVGDNLQQVEFVCGTPALKQNVADATQMQIVELEYAGNPTQILVFENGKLKDWRSGSNAIAPVNTATPAATPNPAVSDVAEAGDG